MLKFTLSQSWRTRCGDYGIYRVKDEFLIYRLGSWGIQYVSCHRSFMEALHALVA
jgi:hypothetical protein